MFSIAYRDEPAHVLVPLDFSDATEAALRRARELSRALDARLTLLHVQCEAPNGPGRSELDAIDRLHHALDAPDRHPDSYLPAPPANGNPPENLRQQMAAAERMAALDALDVETAWRTGHPVREIMQYAEQCDVDLIVLGVAGGSTSSSTLLGSVSDEVIRRAACPVLVVRDPQAPDARLEAYQDGRRAALPAASKRFLSRANASKLLPRLARFFRRKRRPAPTPHPAN